MTALDVLSSDSLPDSLETDVVLIGASTATDGTVEVHALPGVELDPATLAVLGISGTPDQLVRLPTGHAYVLAVIGLGAHTDARALREGVGSAVRQLSGVGSVHVALPLADAARLGAVLEGAGLGGYEFAEHRGAGTTDAPAPVAHVTVIASPALDAEAALVRSRAVVSAVALTKDLVNAAPNALPPAVLADRALASVAGLPVETRVWDETALAEDGFGGIAGVGQGSSRPPRLVRLDYSPAGATRHLALVGKGITFDSGGLSLKPPASMVGMKNDMTGAATCLAVLRAAAQLQLPVRITAWLCLAENLPSGTAIRPNDVLTMRGGRTVEVLNTDAEGRLVLADGLVAAAEERPDVLLDVATLTGAQRVALGDRHAGVMGDQDVAAALVSAAAVAGEDFWPMPLPAYLRGLLRSSVADIANAKPGNTAAGMLLAGVFLQEFIARREDGTTIPWGHIDIAGPAWNDGGSRGFTGQGPTGAAVRALIAYAEASAAA